MFIPSEIVWILTFLVPTEELVSRLEEALFSYSEIKELHQKSTELISELRSTLAKEKDRRQKGEATILQLQEDFKRNAFKTSKSALSLGISQESIDSNLPIGASLE